MALVSFFDWRQDIISNIRILGISIPDLADSKAPAATTLCSRTGPLYLVGAFPPPFHGMASVNEAVRLQMERMGCPLESIDIAAPSLDRSLTARLARLPRVLNGLLRFGIRARHGETLYMSVSGGFGQLYEVLFLLVARLHCMQIYLHHHSYAYIDRPNAPTSFLMSVAGSETTHIALSNGMAAKLSRNYHHAKRVIAISNVALLMEDSVLSAIPRRKLKKIGFLGNISWAKGVIDFLSVAEKLETTGVPVQAILAGPFQDPKMDRMIRERLNNIRSVEYVGPKYGPNKTAFFHELDVLLFPTQYVNEAEPLTILEALMYGVPIIAYGRGAIGEIISPSCGLVIDPANDFVEPALTQIRAWNDSPESFQAASQAAHERFLVIYAENKDRWESIRAEIISKRRFYNG